jgi:hypothetical protein
MAEIWPSGFARQPTHGWPPLRLLRRRLLCLDGLVDEGQELIGSIEHHEAPVGDVLHYAAHALAVVEDWLIGRHPDANHECVHTPMIGAPLSPRLRLD